MDKPGIYSTEFWLTAVVGVVGTLASLGLIAATDAANVNDAAAKTAAAVAAWVGVIAALRKYVDSRTEVKVAASPPLAVPEVRRPGEGPLRGPGATPAGHGGH